jgi:disulfide oxidoreductase YuzD
LETAEMSKAYLQYYFGDQVELEHYDMAIPEQYEKGKVWLDQVPEGYLFYPLVFVNGELRVVGSAEYYEILGAVREVVRGEAAAT